MNRPSKSRRYETIGRTATVLLIFAALAASACQKRTAPAVANAPAAPPDTDAAPAPGTENETTKPSGVYAVYVFQFRDSSGRVELWADGPFLKVTEAWNTKEGRGRRWGAPKVALLYNSDERKLVVVNVGQNRFTRLDEARMVKAREDLEKRQSRMKMPQTGAQTPPQIGAQIPGVPDTVTVPRPNDKPSKAHPDGCRVFKRDLPMGLEEESCYRTFEEEGIADDAANALISFGEFTAGISDQIGELQAVAVVAEAIGFNLGVPVNQHKFGISLDIDQEASTDPGELESWERIITLEKLSPTTLFPEDFDVPADAVEEYGIVPWYTPFFGVEGPSMSHKSD